MSAEPIQKVLIIGGTGLTGKEIVRALSQDANFDLSCLVRPSSAQKPSVKALESQNIKIVLSDLENDSTSEIAKAIKGYDTILSAIGLFGKETELKLVDAVAEAGTGRLVPCSWATPCAPGGIMLLRDEKEAVFQRIWSHRIPYTIIDVGFWYQISLPRVPSGKLDYILAAPLNEKFGNGKVENLMIDKRDIGRFVAKILRDPKTLNKKVICYGETLTQTDVFRIVEEASGEKLEITDVTHAEAIDRAKQARAAFEAEPGNIGNTVKKSHFEYQVSMHVRNDNTLENAEYLGYINARELYPEIKPMTFKEFVTEALEGKGEKMDLGDIDPNVTQQTK